MIVRKLRAAKNTDEFDQGKVDALCEQAAGEIERLRFDNAVLRAAMGEIETIANIPPADDCYGSLAVRMGQVWLLARGHQQQVTEK